MNNLKDKVVVITGASGVLCSVMAKDLSKKGAKVALLVRTADKGYALADEISGMGGTAKAYVVDVTDKKTLEKAKTKINHDFGACDILINGAGGNHPKSTTGAEYASAEDALGSESTNFFDLTTDGFNFVFGLNLIGTILPTQVFAADMVGRKGCSILNISSMNAYTPLTKIPAYSAAKAAVSNFTMWLAVHFSKIGIRVNAIAPGFFVTAQNKNLLMDENEQLRPRGGKIIEATPMGRFGTPDELLGAVSFLCDETQSGFVTGIIIPIDGGFSAYSGV